MSEVTHKPGWYPANEAGAKRWWDGQAWGVWWVKPEWRVDQYGNIRMWDNGHWGELKPRTNHVLHLLLSIITFGLWIPVWIIIGISNA